MVLRRGAARAHASPARRDAALAGGVHGPVRRRGRRSSAWERRRCCTCGRAPRRRRSPRSTPGRASIAILREPASLLRSLHLQFIESYVETEPDLRTALELEPSRREGRNIPRHTYWPQALAYSEHVRYVEQLRRYSERFPPGHLLVLIYDDFRRDNAATVRTVLRFLEVDDSVPVQSAEVNPTVVPRSQGLHELLHALTVGRGPLARGAKAAVKRVVPRKVRRDGVRAAKHRFLYAEAQPPDEALMAELRIQYKPEVVALSEYLGRDLVHEWGYDALG